MKLRKKNERCAKSLLCEIRTEHRLVGPEAGVRDRGGSGGGRSGLEGPKAQAPNCKFWGYKVQHSDYS